jgi:small redox-active disulfide protein 2
MNCQAEHFIEAQKSIFMENGMEIQVCGPGCAKCNEVERVVNQALAEAGIQAEAIKVTDFNEIAKLGVFSTPAVVIDGQIKCVGKVPTIKEVHTWLGK